MQILEVTLGDFKGLNIHRMKVSDAKPTKCTLGFLRTQVLNFH